MLCSCIILTMNNIIEQKLILKLQLRIAILTNCILSGKQNDYDEAIVELNGIEKMVADIRNEIVRLRKESQK